MVGLVTACLVSSYIFPVLKSAVPIYICAGTLLIFNICYFFVASKKSDSAGLKDIVMGMTQVEADLILLTIVLHFSGGVVNPFFLFYIFPVIIATIILPRNLSFVVGLTAILLFALLAVNELKEGVFLALLGYHPLQLSVVSELSKNPVYVLGAFVAFVFMVVLTQYLTRIIIARMTAKELEAARNSDLLKAVINAMSEGLIFVNDESDVAICNPAATLWKRDAIEEKLSDRKLETTEKVDIEKDKKLFIDFPPALVEYMKGLFTQDQKETRPGQTIEFNTAGSEPRNIEARVSPVIGIEGSKLGFVIVGKDLTEYKKLTKELIERTEEVTAINEMLKMSRIEMAQREKMVAIGQMAAGIAHEIGNPLASLSSVAQYLGRKLSTHEEKEHLLLIKCQVNRISNILKRMLRLSRPATAEYRWVDVNELIDNTLSLVKFDKRIHSTVIENVSDVDLPMVWLNPQLFEQVLLNIFINALDAMNAKQDEEKHILKITREFKKDMIEVRVNDTGIGMSPEVCKRAFESFFTTKEIGKGTGLGLFISYNLITEIDGSIFMESEPGKGTTVIIRIPIRPKKELIVGKDAKSDFPRSEKAG
ncbi:MAG: two-component system sensor histidine kinase NtrB [Planctomycetota bacterium]